MKSKSDFFRPFSLLQLTLGLFFGLSGLLFLASHRFAGVNFNGAFGSNSMFNLLIALIELAIGVVFIIGIFVQMPSKLMFISGIIMLILWILFITMGYFINNLLEPTFLSWLQKLSLELIVLGCIWGVTSQYVNQ